MLKTIIGGIAVGIANIIPGVSGGTMMVILGIFDPLMAAINDFLKLKSEHRLQDLIYIMQVLIGAVIGLVGFANVIEFLFANYYVPTMYWFIGLVVCSIPVLLKKEMKGQKFNISFFIIGILVIVAMYYFSPEKGDVVITEFPPVSIARLIKLVLVGCISGATMILPGVSGSMMMLIIGEYYYFKSYLANVLSFQINIIIPLFFIAIGIALGIILSAKITSYCLEKYRSQTMSLILGLIVASSIVLIPLSGYSGLVCVLSVFAFILGGVIVFGIEKLQ